MLIFKNITLEDQTFLKEKLSSLNSKLLNYNFTVLFIYRNLIYFQYAVYKDFIIIKTTTIEKKEKFLYPVGKGDFFEAFDQIEEYCNYNNIDIHFLQFDTLNAPVLLKWAEKFDKNIWKVELYDIRGDFEYIYNTKDLAELEGHLYKPKRNRVNHFINNHKWSYENITPDNLKEIIEYSNKWDFELNIAENSSLNNENIALKELFKNYFELAVEGIVLKVEDKIVAFCCGCQLCDDTFLVMFEKADRAVVGSYAFINKLFASLSKDKYKYLNRAEDCGNEGLRKAKLSYNPTLIQKVYHLEIISC